jgi:two-component system LytT family response regulator
VSLAAENKIGALIVDDEELARQVLRELLQAHPEIHVLAECANGFEAVKAVTEHKPDLIFLDVQMPKLTGFDVLEFESALGRVKTRVAEKRKARQQALGDAATSVQRATDLAASARPPQQFLERIVVRDGTRVTLIPTAKLDYVEAQDDYIALATHGAKHLKQQTIASIEAGLDPGRFVRIHRSYIVNFERVARIEPYGKDSRLAILADGTRLPVSRAGYARLKSLLDDRA